MSEQLHLGVDVGTTAIKAAVFDSVGRVHAQKTCDIRTISSKPGRSSQSMSEVWETVAGTMRAVSKSAGANRVSSIGVCGQGDGLWLIDDDLKPVRNAILWNDQRANDLIQGWMDDGTSDGLSRFSRTALWAGTSGTAFRWLKENEPEKAGNIRNALYCKDWINLKLTGNLTTDYSDATIPFLDLETRRYADRAFDLLDVGELKGKFPEPQPAIALNGTLKQDVARELGLPAGISVAVGCIDLAAMITGMGLGNTGDICLVLGTSAMVAVIVDPERFEEPVVGATLAHPHQDNWIRVLAPLSGTSALDWFTSIDEANFGGEDAADVARRLNAVASASPAGANGVMFLPFLAGERAPFVAPHATASFVGITSSTTRADMARAVMEGTAFSLRNCFEATGAVKPGQIFLTGGGARNRLWCDIIASVMNTTILASDESDHGLWGAAMIGACASGCMDAASLPSRNETVRSHMPDAESVQQYEKAFLFYQTCVSAFPALWDAKRETWADN